MDYFTALQGKKPKEPVGAERFDPYYKPEPAVEPLETHRDFSRRVVIEDNASEFPKTKIDGTAYTPQEVQENQGSVVPVAEYGNSNPTLQYARLVVAISDAERRVKTSTDEAARLEAEAELSVLKAALASQDRPGNLRADNSPFALSNEAAEKRAAPVGRTNEYEPLPELPVEIQRATAAVIGRKAQVSAKPAAGNLRGSSAGSPAASAPPPQAQAKPASVDDKPVTSPEPAFPARGNPGLSAFALADSTISLPAKDGYDTLYLPSRHASYLTQPPVWVKRLTVSGVRGIVRASASQSLPMLVHALGETLDGFDVLDLTEPDFHYLMYWHRLNSYKKLPFSVPWTCDNPEHVAKVHNGQKGAATLSQATVANSSTLEVKELDGEAYNRLAQEFSDEFAVAITLPTVRDMIAVVEQEAAATEEHRKVFSALGALEHLKDSSGNVSDYAYNSFLAADVPAAEVLALPKYAEIAAYKTQVVAETASRNYANNYAVLLDNRYGTLQQRWDILKDLPPDAPWVLDKVSKLAGSYGVNESWLVTCGDCGASKRVKFRLDALTFLP